MCYSAEVGALGLDSDVLLSREEVYHKCIEYESDSPIAMDTALPFIPESSHHRVIRVYKGT